MKRFLLILLMVLSISCSNISELNQNVIDPTIVDPGSLFASAEKRLADQIVSIDVNTNNLRVWTQHFQQTAFPEQSRYDQTDRRNPDNLWQNLYKDVIKNLNDAKAFIEESEDTGVDAQILTNQLAIIDILEVFAYSILVESFGDIVYQEAMDPDNSSPNYEDAETIYRDLIEKLTESIGSLSPNSGSFSSSEDLIYDGNTGNWILFGNSLKLRMGMIMADVDPSFSKKVVEEAYKEGVIQNVEDMASYKYSGVSPNDNPFHNVYVSQGRFTDYVAGETFTEILNGLEDPRRSTFFDTSLREDLGKVTGVSGNRISYASSSDKKPMKGVGVYSDGGNGVKYLGSVAESESDFIELNYISEMPDVGESIFFNPYIGSEIGSQGTYTDFINVNDKIREGDRPGVILSYSEIEFLLAEAAERGYNVGDAKTHYEDGIRASFEEWGAPAVDEYLERNDVKYSEAIKQKSWKEVIGTQAWIALFNRTFAPYLSIRRLDYPILVRPVNPVSGFPNRFIYPADEHNLNGPAVEEASQNIGGDSPETLLFWDSVDPMTIWNW